MWSQRCWAGILIKCGQINEYHDMVYSNVFFFLLLLLVLYSRAWWESLQASCGFNEERGVGAVGHTFRRKTWVEGCWFTKSCGKDHFSLIFCVWEVKFNYDWKFIAHALS